MTHLWSNDSTPIIEAINLVDAPDFSDCAAWEVLLSVWKQIYCFPNGGSFNDVSETVGLYWHRHGCIDRDGIVVVSLSRISVALRFFK